MSSKLYAILDLKGSTYGNVFDAVSDADAVRVFDSFVLSENSVYYKYCEDFALVALCSFDAATGSCSDFRTSVICTAVHRRIDHDASVKFLSDRVDEKATALKDAPSFVQMGSEINAASPSDSFEPLGGFLGDL